MLFNSYIFLIFLFVTCIVYFHLNRKNLTTFGRVYLVASSLFFYGWWDFAYLPVIIGSIIFNYFIGLRLGKNPSRFLLSLGILSNIVFLGYFKYANSLINFFNEGSISLNIILPLAISYFTFQQIAFLVDSFRGETKEYNFLNYSVFITFFPQLLMGPIIHHKDLVPQFDDEDKLHLKWENVSLGLFIFSIGLAKKSLLGDPLSAYGESAFLNAKSLTLIEAWYSSLSYVLAYYYDLSGYADMAIGIGKIFNINIPLNFRSPYKARNMADYWRRWHITLSKFLGEYVYKSLKGDTRITSILFLNILITFLVSGLWHGAGWTFVFWGFLNGILVFLAHWMKRHNLALPIFAAWALMFLSVILTRILFVSSGFSDAWFVIRALFDYTNVSFSNLDHADLTGQTPLIIFGLIIALFFKNCHELSLNFKPNFRYLLFSSILMIASLFTFGSAREFLYFQF